MELFHWDNLCLTLVQLIWRIFWMDKNKNREKLVKGSYHQIQHPIIISSVLRAEGGI